MIVGFFEENMADKETSFRSTTEKRTELTRSEGSCSEEDSLVKKKRREEPREDACSSLVTLGLFHDFLVRLNQCFNETEYFLED